MSEKSQPLKELPALKVKQWVADWNRVQWDARQKRSEPKHWFYQFSIPAAHLRALSGIYPRTSSRERGVNDLGIQRAHEEDRSKEIARFVRYGFPWSDLSTKKRESGEYQDLQKPGWLPTAIVVNILTPSDKRLNKSVSEEDRITVKDGKDRLAKVHLPSGYTGPNWRAAANGIPPIEVIDGQHRLWAFEGKDFEDDFELPVVAFLGLDISWQAYLFYTINIKPKKINASLAFDLYPLLRTEDWLTKFEGHSIYRETRAQEIVDLLWSHPKSPWFHRINMLGERGLKGVMVTQAAWIRSLLAAYIKSWEGRGTSIGGLFGTAVGSNETVLPWSRTEQAAFVIVIGQLLQQAVKDCNSDWAQTLRKQSNESLFDDDDDQAFQGSHTLLNQDQGIRAFLHITNDMCFVRSDELGLESWGSGSNRGQDLDRVTKAISSLKKKAKLYRFLKDTCAKLALYDWRASSAPGLSDQESLAKAAFRGSGGYKELRKHVLRHLSSGRSNVSAAAKDVIDALKY